MTNVKKGRLAKAKRQSVALNNIVKRLKNTMNHSKDKFDKIIKTKKGKAKKEMKILKEKLKTSGFN